MAPHLLAALFDLIAFLAILVTLVFLCKGWKRVFLRETKVLFIALILFTLFYNLLNLFHFLEWSGITKAQERLENLIGALIPMWWAFAIYAFLQDVAQRELRNSEERYRTLIENIKLGIGLINKKYEIVMTNTSQSKMVNKTIDDLVGKHCFEAYEKRKEICPHCPGEIAMQTGRSAEAETYGIRDDGSRIPVRIYAFPVFSAIGEASGFIEVVEDITERKNAEQVLRFTQFAVDHTSDAAFWVKQDAKFVYVNEAACRMLGYSREELLTMSAQDIDPDFPAEIWPQHWQELKEKKSLMFERNHRTKTGEIFPVEITENFVEFEGKEYNCAFVRDITERKQAEQDLRESEEKHRTLFETMAQGVVYQDVDGQIISANPAAERILGLSEEQMLDRTSEDSRWQAIHEDGTAFPGEMHAAMVALRTGEEVRNVVMGVFNPQTDAYRWIAINAVPQFKPGEDSPCEVYTTFSDITERKQAEEALRESEERLQSIFRAAPTGIGVVSNRVLVQVNERLCEMLGYSAEELIHQNARILYPTEEDYEFVGREKYEQIHNEGTGTVETRWQRKDGEIIDILLSSTPLDPQNISAGVTFTALDITERKRAEEEMQKLAAVVKHSSELVNLATLDGRMIFLNEAGCTMLGIDPEEVDQVQIMQVIPDHLKELVENEVLSALMKGDGWEGELQYLNLKTKELTDVYAVTFTVQNPSTGAPLYLANVSLDITERKKAEEALREREETIRALVESSRDWIWSIDIQGVHTYCNPAIKNILGYSAGELIGKHSFEFMHEEDRKKIEAALPEWSAEKRGWKNLIMRWRHKDGDYRYLESNAVPILNSQDELIGFRGVDRDISDRKQAEAEREKLIHELEAKNAELERFTYTVSHDLKSPLITTKGFIGMLEQDLAEGNQELIAEDMQRISHAAETMERLLEELLELSRIGRIVNPPEKVFLSDLAKEAWTLLSGEPNTRNINFAVAPDQPVVYGDRIRLREVLQNLIENSIKFMGDQSEPRIEIGLRQDKGENVFYIRDNGVGIDSRYHEKIFGLFDKLNSEAVGTGIGLAIVKRIVEVHGGRIWVESEGIGRGSTFCFTLAAPHEGESA